MWQACRREGKDVTGCGMVPVNPAPHACKYGKGLHVLRTKKGHACCILPSRAGRLLPAAQAWLGPHHQEMTRGCWRSRTDASPAQTCHQAGALQRVEKEAGRRDCNSSTHLVVSVCAYWAQRPVGRHVDRVCSGFSWQGQAQH